MWETFRNNGVVAQPGFTLFMLGEPEESGGTGGSVQRSGSKQDAAFPDRRIAMRVVDGCLPQVPTFFQAFPWGLRGLSSVEGEGINVA